MPQVLIVGEPDFFLRERAMALAQAGFCVTHAEISRTKEALRQCHRDLVVIGHTMSKRSRRRIAELIEEKYPITRVIYLHSGGIKGLRPGEGALNVQCPADELVQSASVLLGLPPKPRIVRHLLFFTAAEYFGGSCVSLLEHAGYKVVKAATLSEVQAACAHSHFDVAVLGPDCGPHLKTAFCSIFRPHLPSAAILELGPDIPNIPGAHCIAQCSEGEILLAVRNCLGAGKTFSTDGAHQ